MTPDLKIIADNKDALLRAEIAAWLHDMGKCADSFLNEDGMGFEIKKNLRVNPHKAIYNPQQLEQFPYWDKLSKDRGQLQRKEEAEHNTALWRTLDKLQINTSELELEVDFKIEREGYKSNIKELILWGRPLVSDKFKENGEGFKEILKECAYLAAYLGRSHGSAHIEKEESNKNNENIEKGKKEEPKEGKKKEKENIFISSPLGYEEKRLEDLDDILKKVLTELPLIKSKNYTDFIETLRNEFQLALGDTRRPINEITLTDWSSIVAALYKSALAGALLGIKSEPNELKWRLMAIRFDSEQILKNASKIPILLARKKWLSDGLDNVKKLLEETYPIGNEVYRDENGSIFVVPDIKNLLQIKDSNKNITLKELISNVLSYDGELIITPTISDNWIGQKPSDPNKGEIPPIASMLEEKCHSLPDPKAVKKWWDDANLKAQNKGCNNPEICTISWLRPQDHTKKERNASSYWAKKVTGRAEEWYNKDLDKTIWIDEVADSNGRICLIVGKLDILEWLKPNGYIKTLFVDKKTDTAKTSSFARMSRVWKTTKKFWEDVEENFEKTILINQGQRLKIIGEFKSNDKINNLFEWNAYDAELERIRFNVLYTNNNEFIIIENLHRLAKKFGASSEHLNNSDNCIEYIKNKINTNSLKIYDSDDKNRVESIVMTVLKVEFESKSYIPAIPILSEPSIFMAIVPADNAIKILEHIKEKYEKEMGKVRNRLPLTIGMVFAKSHTPLIALMDAGQRMLKIPTNEETWILNKDAEICDTYCILNFNNEITWKIPIKMGDGVTDDEWYPYFYRNGDEVPVHVKELKKNNKIKITPSYFDFEFLDTSSRRFEVTYEKGKRLDVFKSQRPYLLEELENFTKLWNTLSSELARNQIKNVIGFIESKREEWLSEKVDDVFKTFVHDVLHNANWKCSIPTNIKELEKAAISGKLKDIVELNMDILKVRNIEKKEMEISE